MSRNEDRLVRPFIYGFTGLGALLAAFAIVLFFVQKPLEKVTIPAPRVSPRQQLEFESGELARRWRENAGERLARWRWVDSHHRFAEIPPERAFETLARRRTLDPFKKEDPR